MTATPVATTPVEHVTALPARLVAAWAAHDAQAFGELFVDTGTMILPGVYCKGRLDIVAFMEQAFAGLYRGTRVTGTPLSLEWHGDRTAVLITAGGVIAAGADALTPEREIRATWVAVRGADDSWRLAAYQNSPART